MRGSMTAVPTILVVDDEPHIVRLVRDYLERAGLVVLTASRGDEALRVARTRHPDLVVLDLGLPGVDGLDVTKALRREPATAALPIIVLTARGDESDRIVGLELGADDYVTKPFSPRELAARVKAVLRRAEAAAQPGDVVRIGEEVLIDLGRREARFAGRVAELTPTEFELVAMMARQPGRVFTRAQLLDAIHGVAIESYERAIDAHVKNIRRKIEPDPRTPRYLLTVFGVGYRFADLRS
jgi:two-component system alkaline phosphatase synthesis response regulator PhoP